MTEIDFIPQWYQAGRSRRLWYQRQVFVLCLGAVGVVVWCFAAGRGLSQAQAELTAAYSNFESGIGKIQQREQLVSRHAQLQKQAAIMDSVVPRSSYSAILAELSCCIGPDMVVKKLEIGSESIESGTASSSGKMKKINSVSGAEKLSKPPVMQTSIIMIGYAVEPKQVAVLISALEKSDYFCRVIPTYSKNEKLDERDVTEFEIRCVLGDFEMADGKR